MNLHMRFQMFQVVLILVFTTTVAMSQAVRGHGAVPGAAAPVPGILPESPSNGQYVIHQSIEIGYRASDTSGSGAMYDTLVDLHSGPRLLEQALSMQSTTHEGVVFDNAFVNSFGWGGDPDNGLLARFDKKNWYDFRANFRRDQNHFDYNLLANPLNPSTSNPNVPVQFSPHNFATTRRMSDVDLTFLPQSAVTLRFGYSRNNMSGNSYSSVHEGTDALLSQPWNTTLNSYRMGADFKFVPHTVISYDQILDYYKGDTFWNLASFVPALLPGGSTVELGLPIDTARSTPCAPKGGPALIDTTGTLTNLACSGYFAYHRTDPIRTSTPTERISLHGDYFDRLELNGSYSYSAADMNATLDEFFNGLLSRTRTRQFTVTGPAKATRVSDVADLGATFRLTDHLRLVDTFRFWAFRIPETFNANETDWVIPGSGTCAPPTCSLLIPVSSATQTVTPTVSQLSLNQNWKRNEVDVVWDASKHFGGRIGFRYGDRLFTHFLDFTTGDEYTIRIHEYAPLFGFWIKPASNMRFNFDWERTSNDQTIVRIGGRTEARYRVQTNYTPKQWAVLGGSVNLWEASNGDALTDYRGHNRNYGLTATLMPRSRVGFDFAYNYTDYMQNAFICFNDSDTTLSVVKGAASCTANSYNDSANPLLTNGIYTNNIHYGMGSVTVRPVQRVTTQLGYSITSVGGSTPVFNSLQPFGPLQYNYHQPLANVAVDIGHNLTAKMGWNYYEYGEKSFVGPTDPRYFHANNAMFGLRWAF